MKKFLFYILLAFSLTLSTGETLAQSTKGKAKTTTSAKKKTTSKGTANTSKGKTTKATPPAPTIKGLRNEQAQIKKNIQKQEQALRSNKVQVEKKLKDLTIINSDLYRRRQTIDSLNTEVSNINSKINILNSQIANLTGQLEACKAKYVKSIRYMARNRGIQNQLMFIFSGKDFHQIYRRLRFVREYAAYQRTQGKAVQEQKKRIAEKNEQLKAAKGVKTTLLHKGKKEHAALEGQKEEQQKMVNSLQKQQKTIQGIIDSQKKKDAELNAQIDRLVAIEVEKARQRAIAEAKKKAEAEAAAKKKAAELARKKAEAEARAKENERRIAEAKAAEEKAKAEAKAAAAKDAEARERAEQAAKRAESARLAAERKAEVEKERAAKEVAKAKKESEDAVALSAADRMISGGFEANKGRLPSPLAGGRIVSHYGQHGVEGLSGVVLDNKGINILGSPGATVRAIYEGEVSAVANIGGTMLVLVRHGAYISVYCNLSSVSVSRGQKVAARQAIGTVGHDNILQFQLRRERNKLNPESWLAR